MSALPHLLSKAEFDLALSPDTSRVIARGERFSLHYSPHLLPTPEAVLKARRHALLRAREAAQKPAPGVAAPGLCTDIHRLSAGPVDNLADSPLEAAEDGAEEAVWPACRTAAVTPAERERLARLTGPSPEPVRVGVVVAKRFAKRAVMRNLVKRQVYALCQQHQQALAEAGGRWVFRLKAPFDRQQFPSNASDALRASVRQEIEHLLKQGLKRYHSPAPPRPAGAPERGPRGSGKGQSGKGQGGQGRQGLEKGPASSASPSASPSAKATAQGGAA